jgi:hypothetical protein
MHYYKDANTVKSCFGNDFELGEIYFVEDFLEGSFLGREKRNESSSHTIWSESKGYAKILTYKNNDMKISKEFIKANADKTLKEVFPEVFGLPKDFTGRAKTTLVGNEKYLVFFDNGKMMHGFDGDGLWFEDGRYKSGVNINHVEATESEVFEALKNEAVKRGFQGVDCCIEITGTEYLLEKEIGRYQLAGDLFFYQGALLWKDGVWATIIPTITKQEAERQLNKKIV